MSRSILPGPGSVLTPILLLFIILLVAAIGLACYGASRTKLYRQAAKARLKNRWWPAVGVAIVAGILGGLFGFFSTGSASYANLFTQNATPGIWNAPETSFHWPSSGELTPQTALEAIREIFAQIPDFIWMIILIAFVVGAIISLVLFFVGSGTTLGFAQYFTKLMQGEEVKFGILFSHFKRAFKVAGMRILIGLLVNLAGILSMAAAVAGVIAIVASAFRLAANPGWAGAYDLMRILVLMIAGIIVLSLPSVVVMAMYFWAPFIMAENPDMGIVEAMRASRELARGGKWELYLANAGFFGWGLLSGIVPVLGPAFLNAYRAATFAQMYLTKTGRAVELPVDEAGAGGSGGNFARPGSGAQAERASYEPRDYVVGRAEEPREEGEKGERLEDVISLQNGDRDEDGGHDGPELI